MTTYAVKPFVVHGENVISENEGNTFDEIEEDIGTIEGDIETIKENVELNKSNISTFNNFYNEKVNKINENLRSIDAAHKNFNKTIEDMCEMYNNSSQEVAIQPFKENSCSETGWDEHLLENGYNDATTFNKSLKQWLEYLYFKDILHDFSSSEKLEDAYSGRQKLTLTPYFKLSEEQAETLKVDRSQEVEQSLNNWIAETGFQVYRNQVDILDLQNKPSIDIDELLSTKIKLKPYEHFSEYKCDVFFDVTKDTEVEKTLGEWLIKPDNIPDVDKISYYNFELVNHNYFPFNLLTEEERTYFNLDDYDDRTKHLGLTQMKSNELFYQKAHKNEFRIKKLENGENQITIQPYKDYDDEDCQKMGVSKDHTETMTYNEFWTWLVDWTQQNRKMTVSNQVRDLEITGELSEVKNDLSDIQNLNYIPTLKPFEELSDSDATDLEVSKDTEVNKFMKDLLEELYVGQLTNSKAKNKVELKPYQNASDEICTKYNISRDSTLTDSIHNFLETLIASVAILTVDIKGEGNTGGMENEIVNIKSRLTSIEESLSAINGHLSTIESRITQLENK